MTNLAVKNITRGGMLVEHVQVARTYWERLIGLMGRKTMARDEGLIINPCSSVHTHWMRFPIDVVYVNQEDVVVGIDQNLLPWRLGRFYKGARYVIELNGGVAAAAGLQVGDSLRLVEAEDEAAGPAE